LDAGCADGAASRCSAITCVSGYSADYRAFTAVFRIGDTGTKREGET
jgi:hypothetical protein